MIVLGDRYDVSFLDPVDQRGPRNVWHRKRYAAGSEALAEFARGLISPEELDLCLHEDLKKASPGDPNLLIHRVALNDAGLRFVDHAPKAGEVEYITSDERIQLNVNDYVEIPTTQTATVCLVRNAYLQGSSSLGCSCADSVVRLSTPFHPANPFDVAPIQTGYWNCWIEVINLEQLSAITQIVSSSSYEAMTRDLLRFFAREDSLSRLGMPRQDQALVRTVIVRINPLTALFYSRFGSHEVCDLIFHPSLSAPVIQNQSRKLAVTSALLAAGIAVELAVRCVSLPLMPSYYCEIVAQAIAKGLSRALKAESVGLSFLDWTSTKGNLKKYASNLKDTSLEESERMIRIQFSSNWATHDGIVRNDFHDIRSVHTEWSIQELLCRSWWTSTNGRSPYDLPLNLLSSDDSGAREAFKMIHKVEICDRTLVSRGEVEDYLALQSALREYAAVSNRKRPTPLNLGVFGAPGSGKSTGVKKLVKFCVEKGLEFSAGNILEFNMSQFHSMGDLADALHAVRDLCVSGEIPVALFDEFDVTLNGVPFGWLKYLLMPMQDACFLDNNRQYRLGRCVLVFAGGINRTFQELNGRLRDSEFVRAKGPDFISRLRGFLNIRSMNFAEDDSHNEKQRCMIRRAILIKSLLTERHKEKGTDAPHPLVDRILAYALLNIPNFRHGVRSLEAILDMSSFVPGSILRVSHLPTSAQIDMHVDARAWARLLLDGIDKEFRVGRC